MHFCTRCEAGPPHRDPIPEQGTAVCTRCGTRNRIPRVPLFVITGGSGCGKTTVSLGLMRKRNPYLVVDADFLCHDRDAFDSWDAFYNFATIVSLALARNMRPIVLVGGMHPSQIENAKTSAYFSAVHFLVISCDPGTQTARLNGRHLHGAARPPTPESLGNALNQSRWITEAADSRPNVTVLDTTNLTRDQTVSTADRWILERLDAGKGPDNGTAPSDRSRCDSCC